MKKKKIKLYSSTIVEATGTSQVLRPPHTVNKVEDSHLQLEAEADNEVVDSQKDNGVVEIRANSTTPPTTKSNSKPTPFTYAATTLSKHK